MEIDSKGVDVWKLMKSNQVCHLWMVWSWEFGKFCLQDGVGIRLLRLNNVHSCVLSFCGPCGFMLLLK